MEPAGQERELTGGVVWRQMLRFFFPIFLGTVFQQMYSMVDAAVLGRFVGKEALAAVGGSDAEVINLLVGFFVGLSSGASVLVSQYFGARHREPLRSAVYTGLLLSVVCGAFLMIAGQFVAPVILRAIHTPDDIFQYAVDYLRIYFLCMIPALIYNMGAGILRAVGDSRRPLYYLIVCCAVNIVLDLLLVLVIPLGTKGTAIATCMSQVVCAVLVVRALLRDKGDYRLQLRPAAYSGVQLRQMLRIGLPAGLQSSMYSFANIFLQSAINRLGTDSVAAWAAFRKVDSIYWPIAGALGVTVMTFVGQNFGARQYDRLRETVRTGLVLNLIVTAAFSAVALSLRGPLIALFNDDPEVIRIGRQLVLVFGATYLLYPVTEIFSSAMRGVGDSFLPSVLTVFGICGLRLAYLFLFVNRAATNLKIAFSYPLTWGVTSAMFLIYYHRGRWLTRHIQK